MGAWGGQELAGGAARVPARIAEAVVVGRVGREAAELRLDGVVVAGARVDQALPHDVVERRILGHLGVHLRRLVRAPPDDRRMGGDLAGGHAAGERLRAQRRAGMTSATTAIAAEAPNARPTPSHGVESIPARAPRKGLLSRDRLTGGLVRAGGGADLPGHSRLGSSVARPACAPAKRRQPPRADRRGPVAVVGSKRRGRSPAPAPRVSRRRRVDRAAEDADAASEGRPEGRVGVEDGRRALVAARRGIARREHP